MKALQGKKPALRSLRGAALVVFCLAAFAFFGCSEGGGAEGGGTLQRGKEVLRIEVLKGPDNFSLEGWKVDLRGIKVLITYTDGRWEITDDHTRFYTVPDSNATANYRTPGGAPTALISNRVRITGYTSGAPIGKPSYIIDDVTFYGPAGTPQYEPPYWSMALSPDYPFAEYRVLDYFLAYNPNNGEAKYFPLRIPGVWDAEKVDLFGGLPKTKYFIDDVIDLSGFQLEVRYNTRRGLFITENGEYVEIGDRQGTTEQSPRVPFDARWDWSLNYARATGQNPAVRINIGNRLLYGAIGNNTPLSDADYQWNWRAVYDDHKLEALYTVDRLEVTTQPAFLSVTNQDDFFYNDHQYAAGNKTLREEWLNEYLKDTVVTVHYNGTEETKRIVAKPERATDLPMAEYFWGNIYWDYNAAGTILTSPGTAENPGRYGSVSGPPLRGLGQIIRGETVDDGGNPNHSYLVFIHQNVERRGAVGNTEQVGSNANFGITSGNSDNPWRTLAGWEFNRNPDMVRTARIGPVKVYVMQSDDEEGGELTITGNMSYPISPENERGSYEKLMKGLEVTADWIYAEAGGVNPQPAIKRKIPTDDPRLAVEESRKVQIMDNKLSFAGTRMGEINFWRNTDSSDEYTLTYWPWPTSSGVSGIINLDIYDPATATTP